jgi:two-component system chemotaxis response regulator CheB
MIKHDIIVIGGSAGSLGPLIDLAATLPADLDASVFIVMHISASSPSFLPDILNRSRNLKAVHPHDGDGIEKGKIYIAPPDHHLLIDGDRVSVKKGPKENRFRPSIDALFRSAAYSCGPRTIGVILSGLLDDGTSGMWNIKQRGGLAIVQDTAEAACPSMPMNVLDNVEVDYQVTVSEMAPLLVRLVQEGIPETIPDLSPDELQRLKFEVLIPSQENAFAMGMFNMGKLTPFTCPECNGSLTSFTEGKMIRYRCHTGHAFTASSLLAGVTKSVEEDLWKSVRGLEEVAMLLDQIGENYRTTGNLPASRQFIEKARKTREQSHHIRDHIFKNEQMSEDLRFGRNGGEG